MRALWSDRENCSHNVSQKVKRIKRSSEKCFKRLQEIAVISGNLHWDFVNAIGKFMQLWCKDRAAKFVSKKSLQDLVEDCLNSGKG